MSSLIPGHHDHRLMCAAGGFLLYDWFHDHCDESLFHFTCHLLWLQYHEPLILGHLTNPQSGLQTHVHSWASGLCFWLLSVLSSVVPSPSSPVCIVSTILHIPSTQGREKAFSTCASHLTVVILYYTAMVVMYVQSRAIASFNSNNLSSAVYAALIHTLNPFFYHLRNQKSWMLSKKMWGLASASCWDLLPWGGNSITARMTFPWHLSQFCILACSVGLDS